MHMFAPNAVHLTSLVPVLCQNLLSPHWALRKASVACLRQFAQREAGIMCEIAEEGLDNSEEDETSQEVGMLDLNKNSGLPGVMFSLLDHEVDPAIISDIHDALNSMLHSTAVENLSNWLSLCREVLTVATEDTSIGMFSEFISKFLFSNKKGFKNFIDCGGYGCVAMEKFAFGV